MVDNLYFEVFVVSRLYQDLILDLDLEGSVRLDQKGADVSPEEIYYIHILTHWCYKLVLDFEGRYSPNTT